VDQKLVRLRRIRHKYQTLKLKRQLGITHILRLEGIKQRLDFKRFPNFLVNAVKGQTEFPGLWIVLELFKLVRLFRWVTNVQALGEVPQLPNVDSVLVEGSEHWEQDAANGIAVLPCMPS
jgi:hypothetical protein